MCMFVFPGAEPQRIVVQENKQPERIAVFMPDEPDYGTRRSRTMSLAEKASEVSQMVEHLARYELRIHAIFMNKTALSSYT